MAVVADLVPGSVIEGPLLPEPVEVLVVVPIGASVKLIGKGLRTGRVHEPILDATQLGQLATTPREPLFDGDASKFKLGVEAARLGLAYEYDPYFSLSIARIDPLPHQLEAVYDYFLKLPRIRFLLAEAEGLQKKAEAWKNFNEVAVINLVVDKMPELAKAFATQLAGIDKINIIEMGNGSSGSGGIGKVMSTVGGGMTAMLSMLNDQFGIDIARMMQARTEAAATEAERKIAPDTPAATPAFPNPQ